ncbi:MAG: leucyl aminopeptidase [Gemmatimonadales bacterium]|jgi:leucyl aminopeptidase|nr:leucyl aminopeptidase [Gemmatimonadales bacterium]
MPFESRIVHMAPEQAAEPLLAVLLARAPLPASLAALDRVADGALTRLLASGDFAGRRDEIALLYPAAPAPRLLVVGMGKPEDVDRTAIRRGAAVAAKRARAVGVASAALVLPPDLLSSTTPSEAAQALAEGVAQGAWHFTALKRPPEEPRPVLERVDILAPAGVDAWEAGHAVGAAIGAGQTLARGLQVLPSNQCTPEYLAGVARDLGTRHGMRVTVLERAAIVQEGMGALMCVAQGSAEDPRFLVLEYEGAVGAPVVLVGKGVTFDTGGISIKPAQNMEDMKYDMSGAAAVLGTFEMLGRLRPKVRVIGLVPATENMPSGTAVKPGDVVRSHFGKTIEIINTDAEGRLILCDALSYARRFAPAAVVDVATLTGAVVVALGHAATGVMGTDEALVDELRRCGERAGERLWPLPLWDEYRDLMKSDIADVKNSGGRAAGSITGGWFLREFVDGFPWAHLDIAGTAYTEREDATRVKGPTGIGVRLFAELLLGRAR